MPLLNCSLFFSVAQVSAELVISVRIFDGGDSCCSPSAVLYCEFYDTTPILIHCCYSTRMLCSELAKMDPGTEPKLESGELGM